MGSHRYALAPGFIGPLTRKQARNRQRNQQTAQQRRAARAEAVAACPNRHQNREPWDCGCAWGCDHCKYSAKCVDCGKLL